MLSVLALRRRTSMLLSAAVCACGLIFPLESQWFTQVSSQERGVLAALDRKPRLRGHILAPAARPCPAPSASRFPRSSLAGQKRPGRSPRARRPTAQLSAGLVASFPRALPAPRLLTLPFGSRVHSQAAECLS